MAMNENTVLAYPSTVQRGVEEPGRAGMVMQVGEFMTVHSAGGNSVGDGTEREREKERGGDVIMLD